MVAVWRLTSENRIEDYYAGTTLAYRRLQKAFRQQQKLLPAGPPPLHCERWVSLSECSFRHLQRTDQLHHLQRKVRQMMLLSIPTNKQYNMENECHFGRADATGPNEHMSLSMSRTYLFISYTLRPVYSSIYQFHTSTTLDSRRLRYST